MASSPISKSKGAPQLTLFMDPEVVDALDRYRLAHRFPTRAAAVRYLLNYGLHADPDPTPEEWQELADLAERGQRRARAS